jgi:2-methoxy-6-polyprenyl-1,4-benzoquinol methylase
MSMSTRSAWRALHYSAKRRAFQPYTPYRCFSCANRAQEQTKPGNDRMTHFGFTNVPESEKETRGKDQEIPNCMRQFAQPKLN